jgi:nicotinamidase-related amidase
MAQKTSPIKHPSGIRQEIVDKVMSRRGRLYAFPTLDATKTALVVIDLDLGTGRGDRKQIASISENINNVATALRNNGGLVAWVTTPIQKATDNFRAVFGEELTKIHEANGNSGKSKTIWPELKVYEEDIQATKEGHSAFFPGKSNLHEQLQEKGITSLLIVGAVANVCCEASARDAAELHYKVIMVSDALIGWTEEQNQATFATFFRCYGDVRPALDVKRLIKDRK